MFPTDPAPASPDSDLSPSGEQVEGDLDRLAREIALLVEVMSMDDTKRRPAEDNARLHIVARDCTEAIDGLEQRIQGEASVEELSDGQADMMDQVQNLRDRIHEQLADFLRRSEERGRPVGQRLSSTLASLAALRRTDLPSPGMN